MILALWLVACSTPEPSAPTLEAVRTEEAPVQRRAEALQAAADRALAEEARVEADLQERMRAQAARALDGGLTPAEEARLEADMRATTAAWLRTHRHVPPKASGRTWDGLPLPVGCDDPARLACRDAARLNAWLHGDFGEGTAGFERMLAARAAKEPDLPFHAAWADHWLGTLGLAKASVSPAEYRYFGTMDPRCADAQGAPP